MLKRWGARVLDTSVFKPLGKDAAMADILAAMFHRSSATLYFIYVVWGFASVWVGVPSLIEAQGSDWQIIFSAAVFVFALPACIGATFWPKFARLELFSGSAFVSLMVLYAIFVLLNAIYRGGAWSAVILVSSVLVIPTSRLVIVCILLLRQAETLKAHIARRRLVLEGVES